MNGPTDPTNEFSELLNDNSTPALLKKALQLFMAADPKVARDAADKLDELCERRLAMQVTRTDLEQPDVADGLRPTPTDLNERCDALTGRLMKYLGKLVAEIELSKATYWTPPLRVRYLTPVGHWKAGDVATYKSNYGFQRTEKGWQGPDGTIYTK